MGISTLLYFHKHFCIRESWESNDKQIEYRNIACYDFREVAKVLMETIVILQVVGISRIHDWTTIPMLVDNFSY